MIAFGPVPSRRLGRSVGINNIPPKICSYSCVYCQLGRTIKMGVKREEFYEPDALFKEVKNKLKEAEEKDERIDYLTFVPDGEPTLDINLGEEIRKLKEFDIKVAVITNASLIWRDDVMDDLRDADWVSVKIDALDEGVWRMINRPHPSLDIGEIKRGIVKFRETFHGIFCTETMLVKGLNDDEKNLKTIAGFISKLSPDKGYISIPIRPPAEKWVRAPDEKNLNKAYQLFREKNIDVELLIGYEGNAFASTGDVKDDILSIASVHPIREDGMRELLEKANTGWDVVETLKNEKRIVEVKYRGKRFYIRNLLGRER